MAKKKGLDLPTVTEPTPKQRVLNEITNLCVTIGDKSFLIRQTEAEITAAYAKIDGLRIELGKIEQAANGPQDVK